MFTAVLSGAGHVSGGPSELLVQSIIRSISPHLPPFLGKMGCDKDAMVALHENADGWLSEFPFIASRFIVHQFLPPEDASETGCRERAKFRDSILMLVFSL
jgi:hypothetical protein